jgi:peroxiredoxin
MSKVITSEQKDDKARQSLLGLGDEVPNFTCQTQLGSLTMHEYITGQWCMFFSHPADYTPVCTTEIGMVSKLKKEFTSRNCVVIGLSVDSVENHLGWIKDINETQDTEVNFPIIADTTGDIAKKCGFHHPRAAQVSEGIQTVRSVLLIDPNRKIQLRMDYPTFVGRNFYEIIRALDAVQLTIYHKVATPANWKAGEDVMIIPSINSETATQLFPNGFSEIKPYLRLTPAPGPDD